MSLSLSHTSLPKIQQNIIDTNKFEEKIVDVYQDNFIKEIKRIGKYLKQYPYIGMDTEFPGNVYPCVSNSRDFYYQYIKLNVDKLKLIQLGITLTNAKGEQPPNTTTWQFNLKFDIDKDEYSKESINLLYNSGINFNKVKKDGISHKLFAEYLMVSGMVLNENVIWVSFNGFSDFAYLLKLLIGDYLPNNANEFLDLMKLYFPYTYDIKYLINGNEIYKGGLSKIANELNIERKGEVHQAGSDSLVTIEVFFKLIENNSISKNEINLGKNILYGIGDGSDDNETLMYTKFAPGIDITFLYHSINKDANLGNQNINKCE
jgi:CCR4-NOT transcription complex subunit 7/8